VSADGAARLSSSGEALSKAIARWAGLGTAARALRGNEWLPMTATLKQLTSHGGSDRTAKLEKGSC
jgi:hypothetical protein